MLAVYARNDEARRMLAGFAAATPVLSPLWQQVDRAHLIAAIRAALAADAAGEADPLYYLRDELDEQQVLAGTPGGDRDAV